MIEIVVMGVPTTKVEEFVYETTGTAEFTARVTNAVSRPPGPVARIKYVAEDVAVVGMPVIAPVEVFSDSPAGKEVPRTLYAVTGPTDDVIEIGVIEVPTTKVGAED